MSTDRSRFLDPRNDFAFKRLFGRPENSDILIGFLNDILDHRHIGQIVSVTLLPTVQNPEFASKKESILDVLCEDQNGVKYIVEMQVASTDHFLKRAQYYAAKAYSHQLQSGEGYGSLKEVIFLAIVDFTLFPEKEAIKSDHVLLDRKTCTHDLRDFYFTFIELPKFTKNIDELDSMTDHWYFYLKNAPQVIGETYKKLLASGPPVLERAFHELDKAYWSEAEINTYESINKNILDEQSRLKYQYKQGEEEGKKAGIKEGEKKGMAMGEKKGMALGEKKGMAMGEEKGRKEEKQKIARQMLQEGLDIAMISRMTGLKREDIEALGASRKQ